MALVKCAGCGKDISTSAVACPNCGRPVQLTTKDVVGQTGTTCPYCRSPLVAQVRGLQGIGEVFTCVVLFLLFIIPGVIYYVFMERMPYCSGCGRRIVTLHIPNIREAYFSWRGLGLFDLIPGVRDLPYLMRFLIMIILVTVLVLFVVPRIVK